MGANAQTSVPTFTAGEILTAANMNISARTGIPVFATSTTRDDAFGGSGEKTLAEGQFAYLEDSNTTQYYDGASWQAVGTAPGMKLITTVTISAAATTNVNNCFTSTYKNYLILSNLTTSANTGISIRLRVGGTDDTTANYNVGYHYGQVSGGAGNGFVNSSGQQEFDMMISNLNRAANFNMIVANPQITDYTTLSFNNLMAEGSTTGFYSFRGGGSFNQTTSFDGFSIFTGGAPTISGTINIYGMAIV